MTLPQRHRGPLSNSENCIISDFTEHKLYRICSETQDEAVRQRMLELLVAYQAGEALVRWRSGRPVRW